MITISLINFLTGLVFALQILLSITISILVLLNRTEDGVFQKSVNLSIIKTDYSLVSNMTKIFSAAFIMNTIFLNYLLIFKYKIMYI